MGNWINTIMHTVKAYTDSHTRCIDPCTCEAIISHRELWAKAATRAMARKATAPGVNGICIHERNGQIFVYQISGYTPERGLFCDLLDNDGRTTN